MWGERGYPQCLLSAAGKYICSLPLPPPQQKSFRVSLRTCGHGMGYFAPLHSFVRKLLCAAKGSFLPPSLPPSAHSSCRLDVPVRSYRGEGRRHFLKQLERGGGRGGGGDMGPNREVGVRIEEEEEHHGLRRERSLFLLRGGGRPSPVLHRQKHPHKLRRKEAK